MKTSSIIVNTNLDCYTINFMHLEKYIKVSNPSFLIFTSITIFFFFVHALGYVEAPTDQVSNPYHSIDSSYCCVSARSFTCYTTRDLPLSFLKNSFLEFLCGKMLRIWSCHCSGWGHCCGTGSIPDTGNFHKPQVQPKKENFFYLHVCRNVFLRN